MRGMRAGALVLVAMLVSGIAGAAPRTVVESRPRLTLIEDFAFFDKQFNEQNYDNLKKAIQTSGWSVDLRQDESGRQICTLAQTSDVLMIVSHGGSRRTLAGAAKRVLRWFSKKGEAASKRDYEPFFRISGMNFDLKLYASEVAGELKGKQGPRVTVGEACWTGRNSLMQEAFGGVYMGYEEPVDITAALSPAIGKSRGGSAYAFVDRFMALEKDFRGKGPDADKLQALTAFAHALGLDCKPAQEDVKEYLEIQKRDFGGAAPRSACIGQILQKRVTLSGKPVLYLGERRTRSK